MRITPLRQAAIVFRRDFTARVWTPLYIAVLVAPVALLLMAGGLALQLNSYASETVKKRQVVMVTDVETGRRAKAAERDLAPLFGTMEPAPDLLVVRPSGDPDEQMREIVRRSDGIVGAISFEGSRRPLVVALGGDQEAEYLVRLRAEAQPGRPRPEPIRIVRVDPGIVGAGGRAIMTYIVVAALILLTQFFGSQVSSSLIEERSSRLIDALAAAAPLESVLLGKILADFAACAIFVSLYAGVLLVAPMLLPADASTLVNRIGAESGWSTLLLFGAYFTTNYLLTSATVIGLTSLARTVQAARIMLLPLTMVQFAVAGAACLVISRVGTPWFALAAVFPYTSPIAMLGGHLNGLPAGWHALVLVWQMLWVAIILRLAAVAFRRTALNSSSAPARMRRRGAPEVAQAA